MMTLEEQSRRVAHAASIAAAGSGDQWNRKFADEVERLGFELVFVTGDQSLGKDGPLMAPMPTTEGWQYPYPCVVAPKGWKPA